MEIDPLKSALAFIESHKAALIGIECTAIEYENAIKPFVEYVRSHKNQAAEIARLNQLVCDFQASGMIDVGGDDPSQVKPTDIEMHVTGLRAEIETLKAQVELARTEGMNTERSANWLGADRQEKERAAEISRLRQALEKVENIHSSYTIFPGAGDLLSDCVSIARLALQAVSK